VLKDGKVPKTKERHIGPFSQSLDENDNSVSNTSMN